MNTPVDPAASAAAKAEADAAKAKADAAKAEADAAKAKADAAKAEADAAKAKADEAKAEANAAKLKADVRTAEVAAQKAEREEKEAAGAAAKTSREAAARQATAVADKAAAEARRERIAALIPNFGEIKPGELTVKGDELLFGAAVSQRALDVAAYKLGQAITQNKKLGTSWRLLVTADADLVGSDAAYHDVMTALTQLTAMATQLLGKVRPGVGDRSPGLAMDVAAAIAGAVPAALSLFAAHRTVTTQKTTPSDLTAAAAVAHALTPAPDDCVVVHDDFRLLTQGHLQRAVAALSEKRQEIVAEKVASEAAKTRATSALTVAREEAEEAREQLKAAKPAERESLQAALDSARRDVALCEEELSDATVRIELLDSVLSSIDTFTASMVVVPEGAKRSPLTLAAMREQLHEPGEAGAPQFTHVLLVNAEAGTAQQLVSDRPLWSKDRFGVATTATVTYMLIRTADSGLVTAGSSTGTATALGSIGKEFQFKIDP